MAYYIQTKDIKGRPVTCTKEQWENHILKAHDYMYNEENSVIEAIENPDGALVYIDKNYPKRRLYYKKNQEEGYYTKAVVEFEDDVGGGVGTLLTAFMPYNVRPGDSPDL